MKPESHVTRPDDCEKSVNGLVKESARVGSHTAPHVPGYPSAPLARLQSEPAPQRAVGAAREAGGRWAARSGRRGKRRRLVSSLVQEGDWE